MLASFCGINLVSQKLGTLQQAAASVLDWTVNILTWCARLRVGTASADVKLYGAVQYNVVRGSTSFMSYYFLSNTQKVRIMFIS